MRVKIYVGSNGIHTCNSIRTINQNFNVDSNGIHTYIHITVSLLDPHDIHHEGKKLIMSSAL